MMKSPDPNIIRSFKSLTLKNQVELFLHNPELLEYIDDEKVQLEAVKKNVYVIEYIKNPSEKVQLEAVKQHVYVIGHIKNPSEQLQLEAVKRSRDAIDFIKNPSEKVKALHKQLWKK